MSKQYLYKDHKEVFKKAIGKYLKANPWVRKYYAIRDRCINPNNASYKWYGGKGIKCLITILELKELWLRDNATNLFKPSIDRINPLLHYTKNNCRFVEMHINCAKLHRFTETNMEFKRPPHEIQNQPR